MRTSSLVSLAASLGSALATYKGFNYGTAGPNGAAYSTQDFENLFNTAANLVGTSGFNSARLYTMIQAGTQDTVVAALPAAQNTGTHLLLGLWASGGDAGFTNELNALKTAIDQFKGLAGQIAGISVGSEDLYRITAEATKQGNVNPGAEPSTLVNYIGQVRSALSGTAWANIPVGHVDTWTAFANGSNDAVANACDFVGIDAYPYFQNVDANSIDNGLSLFQTALNSLTPAAKAKDVWVTETGWPTVGATQNQAVPGLAQAQQYWDQVGCDFLFGKYNTWWYTLQDYGAPLPNFGVVGQQLSTTPQYNLTCSGNSGSSSSSSSSSSTSAPSSASSSSAQASGSGSSAQASGSGSSAQASGTGSSAPASTSAVGSASASSTLVPVMPSGNATTPGSPSNAQSSGVASYTAGSNAGSAVVANGLLAVAAAALML